MLAIPYENLDIHLGRRLTLDARDIFRKLVDDNRGGWCYEMNGLFARVLESLGFDVRLVTGTVGRDTRGDAAEGNHLVLLVALDETWIADVGFGDGFLEPLPMVPGAYRQGFLNYRVAQDGERWVMHNHPYGGAASFEFTTVPRTMSDFAAKCHELQTSPSSSFVQTTICERFVSDGIIALRGLVLRRVTAAGVVDHTVATAAEYAAVLRDAFGLELAGAEGLFTTVRERHQEWLARQATG